MMQPYGLGEAEYGPSGVGVVNWSATAPAWQTSVEVMGAIAASSHVPLTILAKPVTQPVAVKSSPTPHGSGFVVVVVVVISHTWDAH
jgi:putative effector of murein hydrolase